MSIDYRVHREEEALKASDHATHDSRDCVILDCDGKSPDMNYIDDPPYREVINDTKDGKDLKGFVVLCDLFQFLHGNDGVNPHILCCDGKGKEDSRIIHVSTVKFRNRVIEALRKHLVHLPINKIRQLVCHPECIPEYTDLVMFCMTYKNERVVVMSWKANTIHRRNGIVSAPDTVARGN
jgi:hypothetical protein